MSREICNALRAVLRARTAWDEEPALCVMYLEGREVRLSPILPEGSWPGGAPGQVLAAMARIFGTLADPAIIAALAPETICGMAFRSEMWGLAGPAATAALSRNVRPSQHPDRVDQRVVWAVDLGGTHYTAVQDRGKKEITANKVDAPHGTVPEALEKMVRTITAGVN